MTAMRLLTQAELEAELEKHGMRRTTLRMGRFALWSAPTGRVVSVPQVPDGDRIGDYALDAVLTAAGLLYGPDLG
jgi:hypothetical protein